MRIKKTKKVRDRQRRAASSKPTASQLLNQSGLSPQEISEAFDDKQITDKKLHQLNLRERRRQSRINKVPRSGTAPLPLMKPVEWVNPGTQVVKTPDWFTLDEPVDVSIIIPLYKSGYVIGDNVEHWVQEENISTEILYVDDACPHESYKVAVSSWAKRRHGLRRPVGKVILNANNMGFGHTCNIGAKYASGKYLIFLNADTVVTEGWIEPMISAIKFNPKIGIVGNLHLNGGLIDSAGSEWDGTSFAHIGRNIYKGKRLTTPYKFEEAPREMLLPGERDMVTGACFMMPSDLFFDLGGFDTEYKVGYWEDADLNMRAIEAGRTIYFQPASKIYHKAGHSQMGNGPGAQFVVKNRQLFYDRWVRDGKVEVSNEPSVCRTLVKKKDIVVYTAITGGYDDLKESQAKDGIRFVAFTDRPFKSETWEWQQCHTDFPDANRNAKIHKILPHLYFPDAKYTLWIDGSILLKVPIDLIIESYMKDFDLLVHEHPVRKCAYQEAQTCIEKALDDTNVIRAQVHRYKQDYYPPNNGLVEAGVLLRRHNDMTRTFNETWWEEITNGSKRDQISFNYAANKTGLNFGFFPGSFRNPNYPFFGIRKT